VSDLASVRMEQGSLVIQPRLTDVSIVVEVGVGQAVTIDKCFGPLIFTDIRVTADFKSCEWVIERKRIDSGEWIEVSRVPGQIDEEFSD
jgi:hypothetical protein